MKDAFHQMIELRRSVRRFKPEPVPTEVLAKLVDAARLCPSAANKQALIFIAVNDPELAGQIFETEKFAAYLAGAGQPGPGEEPTAHILVAQDKKLAIAETVRDVGAAVQTILMGACAYGLGATWLRSFDRPRAAQILGLTAQHEPDSVIALGVPAESPQVVQMKDGDVKYWRDETGQHFVPKRSFEEVCFLNGFCRPWG
ncbi:MAG: nitroreductase family protein [Desulfatiglandaceae bacterium]|jgi:nitroreductase